MVYPIPVWKTARIYRLLLNPKEAVRWVVSPGTSADEQNFFIFPFPWLAQAFASKRQLLLSAAFNSMQLAPFGAICPQRLPTKINFFKEAAVMKRFL